MNQCSAYGSMEVGLILDNDFVKYIHMYSLHISSMIYRLHHITVINIYFIIYIYTIRLGSLGNCAAM